MMFTTPKQRLIGMGLIAAIPFESWMLRLLDTVPIDVEPDVPQSVLEL
jgi:hypothetical protein